MSGCCLKNWEGEGQEQGDKAQVQWDRAENRIAGEIDYGVQGEGLSTMSELLTEELRKQDLLRGQTTGRREGPRVVSYTPSDMSGGAMV